MDGTLLRGTTASIEISRRLDRLEPLAELEAGFAAGRISTAEFAIEMRELWSELSAEVVAEVVGAAPWIEGIAEVCEDIAERGERSMLITMSPDLFANHLLELGIDVVAASRFPALPFSAPIDPAGILEPADKVRLAERERVALGLSPRACSPMGIRCLICRCSANSRTPSPSMPARPSSGSRPSPTAATVSSRPTRAGASCSIGGDDRSPSHGSRSVRRGECRRRP
jgi:phosphoserine phosphatase